MTDPEFTNPMSSLPSRPLTYDEIESLEDTGRFDAAYVDDGMVDYVGAEKTPIKFNIVLITGDRVSAVVFIEEDETWYRVYSEPRSEAVLTDAYNVVREVRGYDDLFGKHALTVEEAVFIADRPSGQETSGYGAGDTFECPVCGDEHEVEFHEDEYATDFEGHDPSYLYVTCPEARGNELRIEFQASTPRR